MIRGVEDIITSPQWSQNIQKSLGVGSQISAMLEMQAITRVLDPIHTINELVGSIGYQEKFARSLSGISMITEIAKNVQYQKMHTNSTLSAIEAITNSINPYSRFAIPQTTFDAITAISQQHEKLFSGIRAITEALKIQSPVIAQINSLHFALGSISGQVAALAVKRNSWEVIDDFEQVTEIALDFTETLFEETPEERQRKFQVLLTLVLAFFKKHKKLGLSTLLVIDIFLRVSDIHQYYDFLKEKPEPATKADVNQIAIKQDTFSQYIKLIDQQLKQAGEYRTTNRNCEVKLKPNQKTLILEKLPKGFEVTVIQSHHKWAYVSYFDPIDNLPQTGWIMKKYLDKPTKIE